MNNFSIALFPVKNELNALNSKSSISLPLPAASLRLHTTEDYNMHKHKHKNTWPPCEPSIRHLPGRMDILFYNHYAGYQ